MDMFQLEQFSVLAKTSNMRAAAEKLFLTQPTISYTLKTLEKELMTTLFVREKGKLVLTQEGEILRDAADEILSVMAKVKGRYAQIAAQRQNRISLGIFSSPFAHLAMPDIARDFPNLSFNVSLGEERRLAERLVSGALDAAILTKAPTAKRFVSIPLFEEEMLLSAPASLFDGREVLNREDVGSLTVCVLQDGIGYTRWYESILSKTGANVKKVDSMEYFHNKDVSGDCYLTTSLILSLTPAMGRRNLLKLADKDARRQVQLCFERANREKLADFIAYITRDTDTQFSTRALMYNLYVTKESGIGNLSFEE